MSTKPRIFYKDTYYHIYNRGVNKQNIFFDIGDYKRFLGTIRYYLYEQYISYAQYLDLRPEVQTLYDERNPRGLNDAKVGIIAYILMPNHYHLVLTPLKESPSRFMSDISNSYTRYFNNKNNRSGYLFEGRFKSKEIKADSSLFQLTRYIHLNATASTKTKKSYPTPASYPFSSYFSWIYGLEDSIINKPLVNDWITIFGGSIKYKNFVESEDNIRRLSLVSDIVIESEP